MTEQLDEDRQFLDADDDRYEWRVKFAFAVEVIEQALRGEDPGRRRQALAELQRLTDPDALR